MKNAGPVALIGIAIVLVMAMSYGNPIVSGGGVSDSSAGNTLTASAVGASGGNLDSISMIGC